MSAKRPVKKLAADPVTVAKAVLELLRHDEIQPGDRIPSLRDLSSRLGVGYQTIRQALMMLAGEHHLDGRVGAGTYLRSTLDSIEVQLAERIQQRPAANDGLKVGVIMLPTAETFFAGLMGELHQLAQARGINLLLRTSDPSYEGLRRATLALAHDGCGSIILPQAGALPAADVVRFVRDSPLFVSLSRHIGGLEANFFEPPEDYDVYGRSVARLSAAYLLALGRRRLAFFGPNPFSSANAALRVQSFAAFAAESALRVSFGFSAGDSADVDRCLDGWLGHEAPDGVCCHDDEYALRFLAAAQRKGWDVPGQVSVIGVNDIPLAAHANPPLTTVHFDYSYFASGMLDHAAARREVAVSGERRQMVRLIIRKSCGGEKADPLVLAKQLTAAVGIPAIVEVAGI